MFKLIIVIFTLSSFIATAQEEKLAEQLHYQIGASGSLISGYGMSFHYIFSDEYRIKFTGLYYKETQNSSSEEIETYMTIGIEGQRTISKTGATRIYGLFGASYYPRVRDNVYIDDSGNRSQYIYKINAYTGGAGIGVELLVLGRISFNLEAGALYTFEETHGTSSSIYSNGVSYYSEVRFGAGGGIGFGYRF